MASSPPRSNDGLARALAGFTVLTLGPLLLWDAFPQSFPEGAHDALAATPLAFIALACVAHPLVRRATGQNLLRAAILAAAFLFWAANQFWPDHPRSTLLNDVAVALFVIDVFLSIVGWPSAA
jgi:hypothetical protein